MMLRQNFCLEILDHISEYRGIDLKKRHPWVQLLLESLSQIPQLVQCKKVFCYILLITVFVLKILVNVVRQY